MSAKETGNYADDFIEENDSDYSDDFDEDAIETELNGGDKEAEDYAFCEEYPDDFEDIDEEDEQVSVRQFQTSDLEGVILT